MTCPQCNQQINAGRDNVDYPNSMYRYRCGNCNLSATCKLIGGFFLVVFVAIAVLASSVASGGETIYLNRPATPVSTPDLTPAIQEIPAEAQPTPYSEIRKGLWSVLKLTEKDEFVDFGCGPDARVAIAAGMGIKSKCIGVEIDPTRARAAKERVKLLGLTNVEIIEGDATKVNVSANVGFAFLYPDVLYELIPNIIKLDRFISYNHKVPGLPMKQIGKFWYWDRSMLKVSETGVWQGVEYGHVVCNDPNCPMCFGPEGIATQIQQKRQHNVRIEELLKTIKGEEQKPEPVKPAAQIYTDQTHKVQCTRKYCIYETWRTFSDGSRVMLDRWRVNN